MNIWYWDSPSTHVLNIHKHTRVCCPCFISGVRWVCAHVLHVLIHACKKLWLFFEGCTEDMPSCFETGMISHCIVMELPGAWLYAQVDVRWMEILDHNKVRYANSSLHSFLFHSSFFIHTNYSIILFIEDKNSKLQGIYEFQSKKTKFEPARSGAQPQMIWRTKWRFCANSRVLTHTHADTLVHTRSPSGTAWGPNYNSKDLTVKWLWIQQCYRPVY